jgi:NAD(P)-dependent dehydrogenase (short-subunit alcohol dehydrogenase family)
MDDRVALVTGTSSGIGAALAAALLDDGWTVVGLARREATFDSPLYQHLQVDLGDASRLEAVADAQLAPLLRDRRWTRIGLVNNAALIGALRGLEDITPEQLSRAFAVNAIAPMFLMGFAARVASPSASLRIVNISTGAAVRPFPGLADYGSSKAALRMAGMIMAEELSSDNRPGGRHADASILSYEPGVVDTAMQVQARSTTGEESPWNQPFKDFAAQGLLEKPADVVGDILEFLSRESGEPFVERRYGM